MEKIAHGHKGKCARGEKHIWKKLTKKGLHGSKMTNEKNAHEKCAHRKMRTLKNTHTEKYVWKISTQKSTHGKTKMRTQKNVGMEKSFKNL